MMSGCIFIILSIFFSPLCNTKRQKRVKRIYSWQLKHSAIWSYLYVWNAEECNHKILILLCKIKKKKRPFFASSLKPRWSSHGSRAAPVHRELLWARIASAQVLLFSAKQIFVLAFIFVLENLPWFCIIGNSAFK